ncbi:MAG: radical SAM protein [Desulfobaccales bacterium]
MKTLLMNPPAAFAGKFVSREQCGIGLVEERFLPSEIFLTAAFLQKAGHEVVARDLEGGGLDFSPFQAAVVWVSVLHTYHQDIDWLRRAKESGCRTVMILNDPHHDFEAATLRDHPFIDAAVRLWERELSLNMLLQSWARGTRPNYPGLLFRDQGGLVDTGLHDRLENLDHLTSCAPLLRQQPLHRYEAAGITPGRGCTAGCSFCLYAKTKPRKRRLEDVLAEVEAVASQVPHIFLLDPDLPSTRDWTTAFCRALIERKLKVRWRSDLRPEDADPALLRLFRDSGCDYVLMAVETLDPEIRVTIDAGQPPEQLRAAIRNIRQAGIKPVLFFYIGMPWDSPRSLKKIKQFLRAEPVASFYLKQVRPWPGSRLHADFRSLGLLHKELTPVDFVDSGSPLCPTQHLSLEELEEWKRRIGRAAMLRPAYLWRFIKERRLQARHAVQFVSLLFGGNIFKGK